MDNKNRFNVEEHTTLDNKIIDVFPISHRYIHELEQKNRELIQKLKFNEKSRRKMQKSLMKKIEEQKEVIDKAIELHNDFAQENARLIFENDELIKFMNNLLNILKEVEND